MSGRDTTGPRGCPFSSNTDRNASGDDTTRLLDLIALESVDERLGAKIIYPIAPDVQKLREDPYHEVKCPKHDILEPTDQDLPQKRAILSLLIEEALRPFILDINKLMSDPELVPIPGWDSAMAKIPFTQKISSTENPNIMQRDLEIFGTAAQQWCDSTIKQYLSSYFSENNAPNLPKNIRILVDRHENLKHRVRPFFNKEGIRAEYDIMIGSHTAISECLKMAALITIKFAESNNGKLVCSKDFNAIFLNSRRFINDLMTLSLAELLHLDHKLAPDFIGFPFNDPSLFKLVETSDGLSIELKKGAVSWSAEEASQNKLTSSMRGMPQINTGCPVLHSRFESGPVMKSIYNWVSCIWQRALLDPIHTVKFYQIPSAPPAPCDTKNTMSRSPQTPL